MRPGITKLMAGLGVVAALSAGGATLASAASKSAPSKPPVVAVDGDTLQQGDQTAPDTGSAAEQSSQPASSEAAGESSSEVTANDGPGGHADEPGSPNADHQFQGEE